MSDASPPSLQPADTAVLDALLRADGPRTVDAIAAERAVDAREVTAAVDRLRRAGCRIDLHPQQGLHLVRTGLGCWSDYIEPRHTGRLGRRLIVYRRTTSTQDVARHRVETAAPADHEGTVVVADGQDAGRGRFGRRWYDEGGRSLLLTAVTSPRGRSGECLMLAGCCGVAEATEAVSGLPVQVRWPNDLMIEGRKVGGMLLETLRGMALVGIGLNVEGAPAASSLGSTTSLATHGGAVDRLLLLDRLLGRVADLAGAEEDTLIRRWRARSCLLQKRVTVRTGDKDLTGRVIDLDPRQGLLLAVDGGAVVPLRAETASLIAV